MSSSGTLGRCSGQLPPPSLLRVHASGRRAPRERLPPVVAPLPTQQQILARRQLEDRHRVTGATTSRRAQAVPWSPSSSDSARYDAAADRIEIGANSLPSIIA